MDAADNGWEASAAAWIADMGEVGDYGRRFVLDAPMLARVRALAPADALDVGCGEGRFCRRLREEGVTVTGVEPTPSLHAAAVARDPAGRYVAAQAEALPFPAASFDLVVSYLTLIDIDDVEAAIAEMARVLRPGGAILVANLNSFNTAGQWHRRPDGTRYFGLDHYLEERAEWVAWRGIEIRNWHRPLCRYMSLFLAQGLRLTHFDEPAPTGGPPEVADRYRRAPYFHVMEWRKG